MIRIRIATVALTLLLPGCTPAEEAAEWDAPATEVAERDAPSSEAAAERDAPPTEVAERDASSPEAARRDALTSEGWGPLRIGMTRDEIVAAAGEDANPGAVGGPEPEECDQFRPRNAPEGMIVMVERGRLTRITLVAGSSIRTEAGFGVGDSAAEIRTAYGARGVRSPHKYKPSPADYLTVWSAGPESSNPRGIVYESGTDGRVTHIHAGGPSIQYVEGCL